MARGSKDAYTDKQKRQAKHIADGYQKRGTSKKEAKRRAWATVNEETGGGEKSGSGRGKKTVRSAAKKGGKTAGKKRAKKKSTAKKTSTKKKSTAKRSAKKTAAKKTTTKRSTKKKSAKKATAKRSTKKKSSR